MNQITCDFLRSRARALAACGLILSALLAGGCATTKPIPAPPNNPNPVLLPAVETSTINIPLDVDLDALAAQALAHLPSPLTQGSVVKDVRININGNTPAASSGPSCSVTSLSCLADRASSGLGNLSIDYTAPVQTQIDYQAFLRGLQMRMQGNAFSVTAAVEFSVAAKVKSSIAQMGLASCGLGEAMPRIEFTLPGTVNWTTAGDIDIQPGAWSMRWIRPCNITAFKLNVESLLDLPGVRDKVGRAIDSAITTNLKQVGLHTALGQAWPLLNQPRQVQDGIWLVLAPEKISFGDITGNGRLVSSNIWVQARPRIVSGNKPEISIPPVPPPQHLTAPPGFHIALWGDITLDKANLLLNQKLAGKPLAAGSHTVVIDKLQLYGSGDKAVLGLTLSQPIAGEIYALAKPVFDLEKNELRFENVDFTLESSSLLARSADWMLHGTLRESIEQKAHIRFDDALKDLLKDFRNYRQSLGNGVIVRASLDHVHPEGLYFTPDSIKAYLVLDGKLWVDIAQETAAAKAAAK